MVPRAAVVVALMALFPLACGSDDSNGASGGSGQDAGGDGTTSGGDAASGDGGGAGDSGTGDSGSTGSDGGPSNPTVPGADGGAGCPVFPADNPWNTNVSNATAFPADANSVNIINYVNGGGSGMLNPDFGSDPSHGIPYVLVSGSEPKIPVTFDPAAVDESDPGPYPIPLNAPVDATNSDTLAVDTDNCMLYEISGAVPGSTSWSAYSGAKFDLRSNALRHDCWVSAEAAGLPIFAGLVRKYEVDAGVISHALSFSVTSSRQAWVQPATHQAGSTVSVSAPAMGALVRLKSSFDTSSYTGAAKVVLVALQQYGMYLANNGGNWFVAGEMNTSWNDTELAPLKSVAVNSTNFEFLQNGTVHLQSGCN